MHADLTETVSVPTPDRTDGGGADGGPPPAPPSLAGPVPVPAGSAPAPAPSRWYGARYAATCPRLGTAYRAASSTTARAPSLPHGTAASALSEDSTQESEN